MPFFKGTGNGGHKPAPLDMTRSTATSSPVGQPPVSPFFAPSSRTPTVLKKVTTPGGSTKLSRSKVQDDEPKSSITGAAFNLINTIVGAGIVGIPFAVREAGLVAGTVMVVLSAALTVRSLRLLIETAKHIDVPSYEILCQACFGRAGFLFISFAMLANSFGAMVSYLMIVKSTLPRLVGVSGSNDAVITSVLTISSLCIMLPLSCQRDIAALSKTSVISVCFDCIMVAIVVWKSPVRESIEDAGGFEVVLEDSTFRPHTFFVGLGVLSFAFVCQHGAFIIAGSLERPTKERWGTVTAFALTACGILATTCGVVGYLGNLEDTDGNILNNLGETGFGQVARAFMCCAMFFVYPLESFVARHVCIVLFFRGRKAHEGDDHSVLSRRDRRIALTTALHLMALVPAILLNDLGNVLAISGCVAGSSLSYIMPGGCYLAIHGDEFLETVRMGWWGHRLGEAATALAKGAKTGGNPSPPSPLSANPLLRVLDALLWYALLMPLWVSIAALGQRMLARHQNEEALKSPHPNRLGRIVHRLPDHHRHKWAAPGAVLPPRRAPVGDDEEGGRGQRGVGEGSEISALVRHDSLPGKSRAINSPALIWHDSIPRTPMVNPPAQYGSAGEQRPTPVGDRGIAAAIAARKSSGEGGSDEEGEDDPQEYPPTMGDFITAICFVVFGVVALTAGLFSVLLSNSEAQVGGRRLISKL